MIGRSAGRNTGVIDPFKPVIDRELSSCDIRDHFWNEKRTDSPRPGFEHLVRLLFEGENTTNTSSEDNTEAVWIVRAFQDLRVFHCLFAGNESVLSIKIEFLGSFRFEIISGIVTLYLGCYLTSQICCINFTDEFNATLSSDQSFPGSFGIISESIDSTHSGYDNSFLIHY